MSEKKDGLYQRAIAFARGDGIRHLADLNERGKDHAELGVLRFVAFMRRENADFNAVITAIEEADANASNGISATEDGRPQARLRHNVEGK